MQCDGGNLNVQPWHNQEALRTWEVFGIDISSTKHERKALQGAIS